MLNDSDYLALRPEWVLRNEDQKVILYELSTIEAHYLVLDPISAVIATFLDGHHTVGELAETVRFVGSLPSVDQATRLLEEVVSTLNHENRCVDVLPQPAPWTINYDPLDFMISPRDFKPQRRLSRPLTLLLYYSGWCQTNCIYCYADLSNMRRLDHLSLQQWLPILDQAQDLGIRLIELTGGDPLGRPDSIDFIIQLVRRGFLFLLSTKCYVEAADARRLVDAGFTDPVGGVSRDFQVSIDSIDAAVVDRLMRKRGHLQRAIESIQNLLAAGIPVRAKAVITSLNHQELRDYVGTLAGLGVRHFIFSTYARSFYRHDDDLFLSDDVKAAVDATLNQIAQERPDLVLEGDAMRFSPTAKMSRRDVKASWKVRAGCSAGRSNLGVAPDGRAVLCEQMPLQDPYFFGDLTKQSILEIWNSPAVLDFIYPPRERFAGTACFTCREFDQCIHELGQCFRDAYFAYDTLFSPPPNCPKAPATARRVQ